MSAATTSSVANGSSKGPRPAVLFWLLFLVTFVLYAPVRHHKFINYDDTLYITESPLVLDGLTKASISRAFTEPHAFMWHPLTTLSQQLDVTLFGLDAGKHHLVNALLHSLSSALLFLLLFRMTGCLWRAAIVAAFFAWHPLRVESVAWASERKDTLCALFWMLTLLAYHHYTRAPSKQRYLLLLGTFALGIMTKPLIVTLPFALLLLDIWPLNRLPATAFSSTRTFKEHRGELIGFVKEKVPLFALSILCSVITWKVQSSGNIIRTTVQYSLGERVGNAIVSYARYLEHLFWPVDLVVFYPHPGQWPLLWVLLSSLLLLVVTFFAIKTSRQQPWFLLGWLWFLGTLFPAIGIVQAGGQAMADRYSYIPSIGILLGVVWGLAELGKLWHWQPAHFICLTALPLIACLALTHKQLGYWQNSETLFRHVLQASPDNIVAYENLGSALMAENKLPEAMKLMQEGLQHYPEDSLMRGNYALALSHAGQPKAALGEYLHALQSNPKNTAARSNLGNLLREMGDSTNAVRELQEALKNAPNDTEILNNLALALEETGQKGEAFETYKKIIQLNPRYAEAHLNLGILLFENGRAKEALPVIENAVRLKPTLLEAQMALFYCLAETGRLTDARQQAQSVKHLAEEQGRQDMLQTLQEGLKKYNISL